MDNSVLLNVVRVIGYWIDSDESVIKEFRNRKNDMIDSYLIPFRRELDINLLGMESHNGKRDMLKYYVYEFWELQGFFKEYEYLFQGAIGNFGATRKYYHIPKGKKKERILDEFENYVVECHELFGMVFNEIQLCCFKFKVDFFEICKELDFKTRFIDCTPSDYYLRLNGANRLGSENGFESCLVGRGKRIYPYLVKSYKDAKPDSIAYMLFALVSLGFLKPGLLFNKTKLFELLSGSFGKIGTRQSLNININKLRNPDTYQASQILVHKQEIQSAISKK